MVVLPFTANSLSMTHPQRCIVALDEWFVKPYRIAIIYFQKIATSLKSQLLFVGLGQSNYSFSTIADKLFLGLLLLIPLINGIAYAIMNRHYSYLLPKDKPLIRGLDADRKNSSCTMTPSSSLKSLADLPASLCDRIFAHLDIYALGVRSMICREFYLSTVHSPLWKLWADRFGIIIAEGDTIRGSVVELLRYFALDAKSKMLTRVKGTDSALARPELLRKALELYPRPAWIMLPIGEGNFHFCYRSFDKRVVIMFNLSLKIECSDGYQIAESIIRDQSFVPLKPLSLPTKFLNV